MRRVILALACALLLAACSPATRTDQLGPLAHWTIPGDWRRKPFAGGYVYATRCEHIGAIAYRSRFSAGQLALAAGYWPIVAGDLAISIKGEIQFRALPGNTVLQVQWSDIPGCTARQARATFDQLEHAVLSARRNPNPRKET